MSDQQPTRYSVGDRVVMLKTITEPASDELPAQYFCTKGEVLIVRKVNGEKRPRNGVWPLYVSHGHITGGSFGVMLDEVKPIGDKDDPPTTHAS